MQAIEGNTVEIYLQTEWKRSYTGYTQPVNGRFILNATQVAINVCICLMCVCMSSLVCIHACAVSRRFAFLRVFVLALKHPALTFANTHTRTRKQAVVGDVVRISGRVPPRLRPIPRHTTGSEDTRSCAIRIPPPTATGGRSRYGDAAGLQTSSTMQACAHRFLVRGVLCLPVVLPASLPACPSSLFHLTL